MSRNALRFRSVDLSLAIGIAAVVLVPLMASPAAASDAEYEREPINYSRSTPENAVSRLQQRIADGEVHLEYDKTFGWLPSVLKELDVPESSQMLVYSKTSLQRHRIAPRRPRAIYFGDDVYVGYCQKGDVIEVTAVDPQLGAVFYTVDQENTETPELMRQFDNCLICHSSSSHADGLPGHVVRSVFSDAGGFPVLSAGTYRIDQNSPLERRWGGWYVTGTHGEQTHLGNLIVRDKRNPHEVDNAEGQNVTDLKDRFDTSEYPVPHSDIVALMVMEHQTGMHNLIGRATLQTRRTLFDEEALDKAFGEPDDEFRESTLRRISHAGDAVVEYLLFSGEAKLTGRIEGTSGYAAEFMAKGPRDSRGRSLRDLDLETRLFKYPCSYLIYSEAFDAMPAPVREDVLQKVYDVLTGKNTDKAYAHLSAEDRTAILEILRETKPNLPDYWNAAKTKPSTTGAQP